MEEFLPSEVARLILGYLKENKCEKSWKIFLEECSDLYEYSLLYKKGKLYTTNVGGKSLMDILSEYYILKNASEKIGSISKFSENVSEEVKVILEENIQNAVEKVIQKYLPCYCGKSHHRCDLSTDATEIDQTSDHNLDKSIVLENETENMDQSNNAVIPMENASKESADCNKSSVQLKSTDCDINSLPEELISKNVCKFDGLDHNLQLVEHSVPDRIFLKDIIKVEKNSENCTFLEQKSGNNCLKNEEINCHSTSTDSECQMSLHPTENNSMAVESFDKMVSTASNQKNITVNSCEPMQTNDFSLDKFKQTIKLEPDSSVTNINQAETQNNSTVTVVGNHNSISKSDETTFCSIQSIRGSVNTKANPINLINSQPGYTIHAFAGQSLPVPNVSYPSLPTYFVQNCSSIGSLLPSNSQYNLIINTSANGTTTAFPVTIPNILPNNSGPILTSVSSLSNHNPPSVSTISNNSSSNVNAAAAAAAADFTNTCGKSQTDSTIVLNSVCKAAEALLVAPAKTRKNIALKPTLLTHESDQKSYCNKKGDINHRQRLCLKRKKDKHENLSAREKKEAEIPLEKKLLHKFTQKLWCTNALEVMLYAQKLVLKTMNR